jgi:hypothetical protein
MLSKIFVCSKFTGYKPCDSDHNCCEKGCKDKLPFGKNILIETSEELRFLFLI